MSSDVLPSGTPATDGARAVLVGVDLGPSSSFDPTLDELALLAESAGDVAVARLTARRKAPDAALFVGSGKADEIKALVLQHRATGVIFDQALSPAQQRNLERHIGVQVADRTALILEIFAQRAQSHEGKLQVELARLQYVATRLVRRWSHLERQQGGIGTRGGPGEAQIELDRRMIGERIKTVKQRLEKVQRQRGTQRRARDKSGTFRVSLVGYTNAGKSTLFNALVKARTYAADQLFATLDTTTRQLYLQQLGGTVSLSDTVGFIRDLPHKLVEAFRATLQEAAEADLLLHVVDASSPLLAEQMDEVDRVLAEIGAERIPQILVYNKLDRLDDASRPRVLVDAVERAPGLRVPRIFLSAIEGTGLDALRDAIAAAAAGTDDAWAAPAALAHDTDLQDDSDEPPSPEADEAPATRSMQA
ncbi:GTPase HflX [Aquincola tertiaricarbonis]|uniref:GTPase HflX n=1 Tax=Aquincola tertiaricarbonis TaxID=391953 RepID=A0ABY4S8B0_AQUTE|nr:GTPase HflX [Aquincola tertiaricarbonis]URI08694.1 GTPase HflX [Aquincola tertiaricarbonis]